MCGHGVCYRCHGVKKLVLGALLLLNAFVWPLWTDLSGWIAWIAVLMVVGGFLKILWPTCGHCATSKDVCPPMKPAKSAKPARRRRRR